jgi:hypothetical protein
VSTITRQQRRDQIHHLLRIAAVRDAFTYDPRREERMRVELPRAPCLHERIVEPAREAQDDRELRVRDRAQRIALDDRAQLSDSLVELATAS